MECLYIMEAGSVVLVVDNEIRLTLEERLLWLGAVIIANLEAT